MRIQREQSIGLVIDIQERLFPVMYGRDEFLERCLLLLRGLQILDIPVLLTEQYPEGLGPTLEPVREVLSTYAPIPKVAFSCCDEPAFMDPLVQSDRKNVIILGMEAHVCVLQTTVDLLERGYMPVLVWDCIRSRNPADRDLALERSRQEGALISSSESVLFEILRKAGSEEFKAISRLVK